MKTPTDLSLQEIITERTGLLLRDSELDELKRHVAARMVALKISQPQHFLAKLTVGGEEWAEICKIITTGESYFLRDQGQIRLLRTHILPDLLSHHTKDRTLSIWSAGCSTGEEVYSLAILLDQVATDLSLDLTEWRINLLGTDLNPHACQYAEAGLYGKWSFRGVPPEIKTRYFTEQKQDEWRVNHNLRRFVHFRPLNLLQDLYPPAGSVDLILCRNVLIYFTEAAIAQVVEKFSQTLHPDGYLLAGHGELQGQPHPGLTPHFLPGSAVYRLNHKPTIVPPSPPPSSPRPIRPWVGPDFAPQPVRPRPVSPQIAPAPLNEADAPQIQEWLARAQRALEQGEMEQATHLAEQVVALVPSSIAACLILAQAQANLGRLAHAKEFCTRAIKLDPLSPQPHYLLAHIAQEALDEGAARQHYQKTLYLDPTFVPALLELSMLLDHPSEQTRSRQLLLSAKEQLLAMPADQRIVPYAESAGQLLAQWTSDPQSTQSGQSS